MLPLRRLSLNCFNTQPPEGGWAEAMQQAVTEFVSTRSRPKAAGSQQPLVQARYDVSTRSRPKAAGIVQIATKLVAEFQHAAARRRLDCGN